MDCGGSNVIEAQTVYTAREEIHNSVGLDTNAICFSIEALDPEDVIHGKPKVEVKVRTARNDRSLDERCML